MYLLVSQLSQNMALITLLLLLLLHGFLCGLEKML